MAGVRVRGGVRVLEAVRDVEGISAYALSLM